MKIRNVWSVYNLRETPFFQSELRPGKEALYPLRLFVGRRAVADTLLTTIGSARSSRQTVSAPPGFGKSTLVQYVKEQAYGDTFLSTPDPIGITSRETADSLLVSILKYVHDAVLIHDAAAADLPSIKEAQHLTLSFQQVDYSGTVGFAGASIGASRATDHIQPVFPAVRSSVPGLLRQIADDIADHFGGRGTIIHVNNLENLTDRDRENATVILRDIRDQLLIDGYHYILVGTPDAVHPVIGHYSQVRNIFHIHEDLGALSTHEFEDLLDRRYRYLAVPRQVAAPPVTPTGLRELFQLFHGDLRGVLKALEQAANALLPQVSNGVPTPMGEDAVVKTLRIRYEREARQLLTDREYDLFTKLAGFRASFAQADLVQCWERTQGQVSRDIRALQQKNYVRVDRQQGSKRHYTLTGPARLALRALA